MSPFASDALRNDVHAQGVHLVASLHHPHKLRQNLCMHGGGCTRIICWVASLMPGRFLLLLEVRRLPVVARHPQAAPLFEGSSCLLACTDVRKQAVSATAIAQLPFWMRFRRLLTAHPLRTLMSRRSFSRNSRALPMDRMALVTASAPMPSTYTRWFSRTCAWWHACVYVRVSVCGSVGAIALPSEPALAGGSNSSLSTSSLDVCSFLLRLPRLPMLHPDIPQT